MTTPLLRFPPKDPGETLDYSYDFTLLLEATEQITTINTVTVDPVTVPALAVDAQSIVTGGKIVSLLISGGVACREYGVTVNVTTDSTPARTYERTCVLPVENR